MFNFLVKKSKCPNCNQILDSKPTQTQTCPLCGKSIVVRDGELVTEDEVKIGDWLKRLELF